MIYIIFTYNRQEMLTSLLKELEGKNVFVIDNCSNYDVSTLGVDYYSFPINGGKRLFYQKWQLALEKFRESNFEYVCFLPDDVSSLDLKGIENLTRQGLENFAITLANTGNFYRWGEYNTSNKEFVFNDRLHKDCCYVDGCFITNKKTLDGINIGPMPDLWFDRSDKSSGVGYSTTMQLRKKGALMLMPNKSYLYHGDHKSVMHGTHRDQVKLITK